MDIAVTTILLFAVFGILLFVGCPISVSIVVSSIVTALSSLSWDQITFITMQKMNGGVESFSLLAVPLFFVFVWENLICLIAVYQNVPRYPENPTLLS